MIDFAKLQTFLHVAQSMSFSEAATQLHLTQPTISHHIKSLERDLGVDLFDRSGGGVRLTEAGSLLLPRARKLVRETFEIQQMMESLDDRIVGQLRIACSTTTGKYILPQFAARFHEQHPGVNISVLRCTSPLVVPQLLKEEADLGVVSYDACGDGMECQEFFNDHIILIAAANHPWAARQYIDPSELLEEPMIIREPTSGTHRALLAELGKHSITFDDMDICLEIGNSEAIVKAVEVGFGVSFVSRLAADWALDKGTVVEILVADFDLHRKVFLIRSEVLEPHRASEAFWGFVHDPRNADLLRMAER
jgi:DNA-binding transcriptional LysR family regulator